MKTLEGKKASSTFNREHPEIHERGLEAALAWHRTFEGIRSQRNVAKRVNKEHPEIAKANRSAKRRELSRRIAQRVNRECAIPNSDELLDQEALVKIGEPFFAEKLIEDLVTADIVLANKKVAIFQDGCYWHGCLIHNSGNYRLPNGKMISYIRALDKALTFALECFGWTVIHIWAHELRADHDILGKKVLALDALEVFA